MPYVTSKLRSLIRTRDYLKTKAVKTGSSFIRQAFIQLRDRVYGLLQKSRHDCYTKRINENKGNIKNTWKILKHAIGIENKDSTVEILNSEGQQVSFTCEIVEHLMSTLLKLVKGLRMKFLNLFVHLLQILIMLTLHLSLWRYLPQILSRL